MRVLFTAAISLGAFLLFLAQPLLAKQILPRLGGTPAVWNGCVMFFQVALIVGYAYAHVVSRIRRPALQVLLHAALLAVGAGLLPIGIDESVRPDYAAPPVPWLLETLIGSVGLPFLLVASGSPLLLRWFSRTGDPLSRDPYFLYAASNVGSLVALLAFPALLEPWLSASRLVHLWTIGFLVLVGLVVLCGIALLRRRGVAADSIATPASGEEPARLRPRTLVAWVVLAFIPSSLTLGATHHVTTDVAAVPLFWVVPLAIYLTTYVIAFARRTVIEPALAARLFAWLGAVGLLSVTFGWALPVVVSVPLHLLLVFAAGLVAHGRLAASRPPTSDLTTFFFAIAVGGALGGVFNAMVAPALFDSVIEYPLVIALGLLLRPRTNPRRAARLAFDAAVVVLAAAALPFNAHYVLPHARVTRTARTFFGVHRVVVHEDVGTVGYYHGTTLHGVQVAAAPREPTAYFHRDTGIGRVLGAPEASERFPRVGVIGLGVGTLAAWARPGQRFTFFEIDPVVVDIARDSGEFRFLADSDADAIDVVIGDGRISIASFPPASFDLLVMDAFSSDAVPVHLLTKEAFVLYRTKLTPGGIIAFNVTNRHLDLEAVVVAVAHDVGLAATRWNRPPDVVATKARYAADWVFVGTTQALDSLGGLPDWAAVPPVKGAPIWSDQRSSLIPVIRWDRLVSRR